ncbi:LppU/SCO3897 family protein [Glycomyces tritici]|uniref:Uncharacterized protein n=1 Tax=Glycomyces tritici TaxID=2665176 RepID=A0ABT7YTN0_9ACTN|nr:hypothetical protein [Glycomyces tritici]MDN3242001.1 hypothetical protein [Glycomyces tritici]
MAVLVELLAGAVLAFIGLDFDKEDTPPPSPTYPPTQGPSEIATTAGPIETPSSSPSPTPETPPTDPFADLGIGDCLYNLGSPDDFELEPTDCEPGDFEVVEVFSDSGGTGACNGIPGSVYGYDHGHGSVYCLSYLHPWGDAYYAGEGQCFTKAGDGTYEITGCAEGTVQVLERFWGSSSADPCTEREFYSGSIVFEGYGEGQDAKLCTRVRYPDDIGYAQQHGCLYAGGPEDAMTFESVDCDQANVYVTGRSAVYQDTGFCDGYGWATWQSDAFPEYAYTVCFAWF